jgi:hypothetical protein
MNAASSIMADNAEQPTQVDPRVGHEGRTEQQDIFENCTVSDKAYNVMANTMGYITGKNVKITEQGRNVCGTMNDATLQTWAIRLTNLDAKIREAPQESDPAPNQNSSASESDTGSNSQSRFIGAGIILGETSTATP